MKKDNLSVHSLFSEQILCTLTVELCVSLCNFIQIHIIKSSENQNLPPHSNGKNNMFYCTGGFNFLCLWSCVELYKEFKKNSLLNSLYTKFVAKIECWMTTKVCMHIIVLPLVPLLSETRTSQDCLSVICSLHHPLYCVWVLFTLKQVEGKHLFVIGCQVTFRVG